MDDDSNEYDAAPTEVVFPQTVLGFGSGGNEMAATTALVRRCPECGLKFAADQDFCPRDGSPLDPPPDFVDAFVPVGEDSQSEIDTEERAASPTPESAEEIEEEIDGDGHGPGAATIVDFGAAHSGGVTGAVFEGRFRVEELIGEGGMGKVYRGTQLSVGRPVAIKVIHKRFSANEAIRRRFMREAKVVSSFTHPNTIRLYDFGESDGHLFIAMEFVEGVQLSNVIGGRPLQLPFVFEVLDQVCGSLVEAHKADVVHRDLKPDNIFLTRSADERLQVKLLDFGIAHVEESNEGEKETLEDLTQRGTVVGTPEYMAPEQARGTAITAAADVYSLGIILYQMLSGELPITGGSNLEILFNQISTPPMPITQRVPDCPPRLAKIVERLLQKDPADRVPSALEVRRALRKVRRELGIRPIGELDDGPRDEVIARIAHEGRQEPLRARASSSRTQVSAPAPGPASVSEASANDSEVFSEPAGASEADSFSAPELSEPKDEPLELAEVVDASAEAGPVAETPDRRPPPTEADVFRPHDEAPSEPPTRKRATLILLAVAALLVTAVFAAALIVAISTG